ncbi:hypothetical protein RUND412_008154, partial [Rhizina undulata]
AWGVAPRLKTTTCITRRPYTSLCNSYTIRITRSTFWYYAITYDTSEHARETVESSQEIKFCRTDTKTLELLPEETLVVKMLPANRPQQSVSSIP